MTQSKTVLPALPTPVYGTLVQCVQGAGKTARESAKSPDEFEVPGVEPVFAEKRQAINYAENRASFRSGEIRIVDSTGNVDQIISFSEADRRL